ncbi:MAG: DoxX family protein [Vicinamibacterales bacterium]
MTSAALNTSRPAPAMFRKALNIALWVLQVLLACFFVMVGYSHALMPFDQIVQQATWMNDVPRWLSLFIGYAEIAGGMGLIIPAATRIAPWLTPLAALGLATIMVLAIPFHVLANEASVVWIHALIAAPAAFVAWGRWRQSPITGR